MNNQQTCPRCGQMAVEVKDWGKAGCLFVHSTSVENGIPVQDACHVHAEKVTK